MTQPATIAADYTLRPRELASVLALPVEARQPTIVWGPPGSAKSMIAQQVAAAGVEQEAHFFAFSASAEELGQLDTSGTDYVWIVPHTADTNVAGSRCAYDRIVMDRDGKENYEGVWGVDRGFTEKRVSDHWPVWAEFHVDRDGGRGPVEHGIARDSGQDVDAQACTATGSRDRAAEKGSGPGCLNGRRSM